MLNRLIIFGIHSRIFISLMLNEIKLKYVTVGFHHGEMKVLNKLFLNFIQTIKLFLNYFIIAGGSIATEI